VIARSGVTLLAIALLAACDAGTSLDEDAIDMQGTWSFVATQSTPPLDFQGSLSITEQDGANFSGRIELQEKDAQGTIRNRVGVVSGRIIADDAVDFDAFIGTEPRRHVARVASDSMSGSWAESAQLPLTGKFSARRTVR
jgi:hypothetical protein